MTGTRHPAVHRCVGDVMTRAVVTADVAAPYKELVRVMVDHGISALPVVDTQSRPVGIVSEADLLLKPASPERALISWAQPASHRMERKAEGVTAGDLMSSPVIPSAPPHRWRWRRVSCTVTTSSGWPSSTPKAA